MTLGVFFSVSEMDSKGNPNQGAQQRLDRLIAGLGNAVRPADIAKKHARTNPWDPADYTSGAKYLVGLNPVALFSSCWPTMSALQDALKTAPNPNCKIVYAGLFNYAAAQLSPYALGYQAAPFGDNVTGFVSHEFDVSIGSVRYLRAVAPQLTQAAVLFESGTPGGKQQFSAILNAGSGFVLPQTNKLHIDLTNTQPSDLESKIAALNGTGLIVTTGALTASIGELIVRYANNYTVVAIYPNKTYVELGGLISWGTDLLGLYQRAGAYLAQIILTPNAAMPSTRINHAFELAFNSATASKFFSSLQTTLDQNAADCIYNGSAWHPAG